MQSPEHKREQMGFGKLQVVWSDRGEEGKGGTEERYDECGHKKLDNEGPTTYAVQLNRGIFKKVFLC